MSVLKTHLQFKHRGFYEALSALKENAAASEQQLLDGFFHQSKTEQLNRLVSQLISSVS